MYQDAPTSRRDYFEDRRDCARASNAEDLMNATKNGVLNSHTRRDDYEEGRDSARAPNSENYEEGRDCTRASNAENIVNATKKGMINLHSFHFSLLGIGTQLIVEV